MPTATDERSKWLRSLATSPGNLNRQMRAAASRMEHSRLYGLRVAHDYPAQQLSERTVRRWITELRHVADLLEGGMDYLTGPPQLTEYGKKVAARFAAEDKENPE